MRTLSKALIVIAALSFSLTGTITQAAPITWNTWTSDVAGYMGAVSVTFNDGGSFNSLVASYPSYTPNLTFSDGTIVDNAPTNANGIMQLVGGNNNVNTVSFSAPAINPVFAIWSLGQRSIEARFSFDLTPTFVAGGGSAEYNGQSITLSGKDVLGLEGNGTVQFLGTYSSISWTNPVYEYWYGFNVGMPETAPVPEPGTLLLLGAGLASLAWYSRKRKHS